MALGAATAVGAVGVGDAAVFILRLRVSRLFRRVALAFPPAPAAASFLLAAVGRGNGEAAPVPPAPPPSSSSSSDDMSEFFASGCTLVRTFLA